MSDSLTIQSYRGEYTATFVPDFEAALNAVLQPGDFLVIDENVHALYKDRLAHALESNPHRIIAPCEDAESYQAVEPVIQGLLDIGFRKNNRLIAFGGGIIQDITAFTASLLYRGVDWLFFPTNLLAQCDSCIGSKTSINFGPLKNQLGGFFPAKQIFIDLAFLDTLPERDLRSGLGEMAHYFLVNGEDDFTWYAERVGRALVDRSALQEMIRRSLSIKKAMIERDEFDQGPRNVFNYGHSFGHALESVTNYALPHGIAVSFGMDIANVISTRRNLIPTETRNTIRPVLASVWEGFTLENIDIDAFVNALSHDKKNEGTIFKPILTRGIGNMFKASLEMDETLRSQLTDYFNQELHLRSI